MLKAIAGVGLCCLLGSAGACARLSAYSQQEFAVQQDAETCSRYGARYDSAVFADCMLAHEQRRDAATARQTDLIVDGTAVVAGRR